jgi:hypothetical protein
MTFSIAEMSIGSKFEANQFIGDGIRVYVLYPVFSYISTQVLVL